MPCGGDDIIEQKKDPFSPVFWLAGAVLLGLVAAASHFAYEWSGGALIVGLFNPVNESVWEHLKFMFFPNVLWWAAVYAIFGKSRGLSVAGWTGAGAVSALAGVLCTLCLFYTYTSALGVESVAADVALVFVCYGLALLAGRHVYMYGRPSRVKAAAGVLIILLLALTFVCFTLRPPELPVFRDGLTGLYGIGKTP